MKILKWVSLIVAIFGTLMIGVETLGLLALKPATDVNAGASEGLSHQQLLSSTLTNFGVAVAVAVIFWILWAVLRKRAK
ncbi:MAG: hypothetical protein LBI11_03860 [Streptococcaceae bacterium]|jgi:hypothetical protein|nr:hypothetical protein [Streptococcaceae bacterium]